jgi:fermentation-respiration switch protein FrsA (DUF1100 family)
VGVDSIPAVEPATLPSTTAAPTTVAPAAPPVPTPVPALAALPPAAPLTVASIVVPLVDASRPTVSGGEVLSSSRALTTWVWYPTTTAGGPWPLVVFAHGYEVGPQPYAALCEAWAEAGYVVAAPEFPLTDADVAGDYLDENDIDNQPDDVRFVFDSLLAPDSPLAGRVDPDRLAVAGHSDGGVTALAVAADPPAGLRGVIALSAAPVSAGATAGPPLLVMHGDEDDIDPYENGVAVFDEAEAPRFLVTLLGGGHLPPFTEGSDYLDAVDRVAVDFLDRYVAGRRVGDDALVADADPDLMTVDADP